MALTERQRAVLDLERSWWQHGGSKEAVIRERLRISATRYYQVLAALVGSPDALAHDPLTVRRVRRAQDRRRQARVEGPATGRRPAR
jgi:hypothetical protein